MQLQEHDADLQTTGAAYRCTHVDLQSSRCWQSASLGKFVVGELQTHVMGALGRLQVGGLGCRLKEAVENAFDCASLLFLR